MTAQNGLGTWGSPSRRSRAAAPTEMDDSRASCEGGGRELRIGTSVRARCSISCDAVVSAALRAKGHPPLLSLHALDSSAPALEPDSAACSPTPRAVPASVPPGTLDSADRSASRGLCCMPPRRRTPMRSHRASTLAVPLLASARDFGALSDSVSTWRSPWSACRASDHPQLGRNTGRSLLSGRHGRVCLSSSVRVLWHSMTDHLPNAADRNLVT